MLTYADVCQVWDVLALFGYNGGHLKRLIRNMRQLIPTLRRLLQVRQHTSACLSIRQLIPRSAVYSRYLKVRIL